MSNPPQARCLAAGAALLAALAGSPVFAQALQESVLRVPVASGWGPTARIDAIEVTVFRPAGAGPFPIVVLSHGSPRSAADRRRVGRIRFEQHARAFVGMGYAVVVPTRRGYGDSEGYWAESYGSCELPDYHGAGLESARDILAGAAAARNLPGLDARHIVLVGQSAGGFGSVAASTLELPGVVGVVNFAGGRGSRGSNNVCNESALVDAMRRYGATSRVPQIWLYSPNDLYFRPELARRMHAAFVGAGGRAQFVEAPHFGADGHDYFGFIADWSPRVREFLAGTAQGATGQALLRAGNPVTVR